MTTKNVIDYIGKPWRAGCSGPDAFDCWGLLVDIYDKFLCIELSPCPVLTINQIVQSKEQLSNFIESNWKLTETPNHLDAVALSTNPRFVHHTGVYLNLDGGKVLHSLQQGGVVCESLTTIKKNYHLVKFYEYRC